jgi:phage shock protein PspC (stress-responsive transcriptional regulator)
MPWTWWVATGIISIWVLLVAVYLIALLNYIMHNRVDKDDTIDVMVEKEDET